MNPRKLSSTCRVAVWAMAGALVASCTLRTPYSHYQHLADETWDSADTLCFNIPLRQAGTYTLQVGLRTNSFFPYTGLTMGVAVSSTSHTVAARHSLNMAITNERGFLYGSGISVYQYDAQLPGVVSTTAADTLVVKVCHAMNRKLLPGITDVGITCSEF